MITPARLFDIASDAGLHGVEGMVLRENTQMLALASQLGFVRHADSDEPGICHIQKTFRVRQCRTLRRIVQNVQNLAVRGNKSG
jgi:hypothetical protein